MTGENQDREKRGRHRISDLGVSSATVLEPRRGDLTQPRLKAWVSKTPINPPALKGRNNRFQSHAYHSS